MYGIPALVKFNWDWSNREVALSQILSEFWLRDEQHIVRSVCESNNAEVFFWQ